VDYIFDYRVLTRRGGPASLHLSVRFLDVQALVARRMAADRIGLTAQISSVDRFAEDSCFADGSKVRRCFEDWGWRLAPSAVCLAFEGSCVCALLAQDRPPPRDPTDTFFVRSPVQRGQCFLAAFNPVAAVVTLVCVVCHPSRPLHPSSPLLFCVLPAGDGTAHCFRRTSSQSGLTTREDLPPWLPQSVGMRAERARRRAGGRPRRARAGESRATTAGTRQTPPRERLAVAREAPAGVVLRTHPTRPRRGNALSILLRRLLVRYLVRVRGRGARASGPGAGPTLQAARRVVGLAVLLGVAIATLSTRLLRAAASGRTRRRCLVARHARGRRGASRGARVKTDAALLPKTRAVARPVRGHAFEIHTTAARTDHALPPDARVGARVALAGVVVMTLSRRLLLDSAQGRVALAIAHDRRRRLRPLRREGRATRPVARMRPVDREAPLPRPRLRPRRL